MNILYKISDWITAQFDKLRYRGLRKSFINKVNYVPTGKSSIRVLTEDTIQKEMSEKSKIITDDNRKVGEYIRRIEIEVSKIRSEQKLNNQ